MLQARAYAKLNLALRVGSLRRDGYHELRGLFQSIGWHDVLTVDTAEEDVIAAPGGGPVVDGEQNLAWRAATAVRAMAMAAPPLAMTLEKRLPVAAGLGGGSADAAAALATVGRLLGVDLADLAAVAAELGSDVPFCLAGGRARVTGRGERIEPLRSVDDFAVAVLVPPVEVATAAVYRRWDALGGPEGPGVAERALPPSLRDEAPLVNDLEPAAFDLVPDIAEWRAELQHRWQRPVAMTGSGPSLFAFFLDEDEAAAALDDVPTGPRATCATRPVARGWSIEE